MSVCVEKDSEDKISHSINYNENKKSKTSVLSSVKRFFKNKFNKPKQDMQSKPKQEAKNHGFDIVGAQIIVIFVLVISILLTNVF